MRSSDPEGPALHALHTPIAASPLERAVGCGAIQLAGGMIDSRQSRSLLVVVLWVTAGVVAGRVFQWRPIPMIGVMVLVSALALASLYRLEGRRVFWSNTVTGAVSCASIYAIPHGLTGFYQLMALILIVIAWAVLAVVISGNGRVFADFWRSMPPLPRWPQGPLIRATRVRAPHLAGVVEYDSKHFSTMRVEECSDDWMHQLSQVTTDASGRFALPRISDDPVHCVRVSWPGAKTAHLYVELSADAQPLLVRLKPGFPRDR
jgi:hypothetical protein